MNTVAAHTAAGASYGGLEPGVMYRVSYAIGGAAQRRVTRSLAIFAGASERRQWNGQLVTCLDFTRPHGRPLSLLSGQVVDARPASLNERGQLILVERPATRRRRPARRRPVL